MPVFDIENKELDSMIDNLTFYSYVAQELEIIPAINTLMDRLQGSNYAISFQTMLRFLYSTAFFELNQLSEDQGLDEGNSSFQTLLDFLKQGDFDEQVQNIEDLFRLKRWMDLKRTISMYIENIPPPQVHAVVERKRVSESQSAPPAVQNSSRKRSGRWNEAETNEFLRLVREFTTFSWSLLLSKDSQANKLLQGRKSSQLRDKYRSLMQSGKICPTCNFSQAQNQGDENLVPCSNDSCVNKRYHEKCAKSEWEMRGLPMEEYEASKFVCTDCHKAKLDEMQDE